MHQHTLALTPQKKTFSFHQHHNEHHLKQFSPLLLTVVSSGHGNTTKLELLHSPLPTNQDLFSQLLGTEKKVVLDDWNNCEIMEEDSYEPFDEFQFEEAQSEAQSEPLQDEEDDDETDIKKRKRKSSGQIKILKQQLEMQPNWNKEKIVEMSEMTGLSQSQVYKWWWDQKKKNGKQQKVNYHKIIHKRKIIHKDNRKEECFLDDYEMGESSGQKHTETFLNKNSDDNKINKRLLF